MNNLNTAIKAAKLAGQEIIKIYNSDDFGKQLKTDDSPVTKADLASEKILLEYLGKAKIPIRSEESDDSEEVLNSEYLWIIDPLDGTKDFLQKNGEFCVMISLTQNSHPVLGVVYCPALDLLAYAEKGKGCFLVHNQVEKKLEIGSMKNLSNAKAILSRNHFGEEFKEIMAKTSINNYEQVGSNGLKAIKVLMNKADILFNPTQHLKEWDLCPIEILTTEAGGIMTDMTGEPIKYQKEIANKQNGILLTNEYLHTEFLARNN